MAQRLTDYGEPAALTVRAGNPHVTSALEWLQAVAHLRTWLTYPAWGTLLVVLVLSRIFPSASLRWQFVPFLIGMVFLGLPHGALDHLVPLFLKHRRLTPLYLLRFLGGYMAFVGVYLLFWHICPAVALAIFLLFSWLHWGQGDSYFLEVFEARPPACTWTERLIRWLVRGALPIVVPSLAFPQVFAQVVSGILGWYGGSGGWEIDRHWRTAGIITLAALIATYLWQSWLGKREGFWQDAAEVGLLLIYFVTVPPILAVGVYFCVWHSVRHMARLLLLDEANLLPLSKGALAGPLRRIACQAIPMTAGALALLAGLFWWQGRAHVSAGDFVFLYLSLIAALTFPHFLVVLWMDREELLQNYGHPIVVGRGSNEIGEGF